MEIYKEIEDMEVEGIMEVDCSDLREVLALYDFNFDATNHK